MILIINCGSTKTPFIEELVDMHIAYTTIGILDILNHDISAYKGIILSGAPLLITEIDMHEYLDSMKYIISYNKPVFGICFGHQLLGLHFGSVGAKMNPDRDFREIEVYESCPLFDRLPNVFEMQEDHCESISIAPNFVLVASSDTCVNEAMMHVSLPYYGVQFHPEVSGNLGAIIIENFIIHCLNLSR